MRKLPAILMRFLAGLACLMLSACFDIREEVWIRRDGSGSAELTYIVPGSATFLTGGTSGLETKIRTLVASQPKLRLDSVAVTEEDDRAKIAVKISTDSMFSLVDLKKSEGFKNLPASAVDLAGSFDVRMRGLTIDFARTVRVKEALGWAALGIGAEDRADRHLTYVVHLPTAAKESNATSVEDGGKTLTWDSTLGEALKGPVVTSFKARMPIPAVAWFAAGLIGLALIGLTLRIHRSRRKRSEAA